jgi:tetratricopeptide (TPR) repeat protein
VRTAFDNGEWEVAYRELRALVGQRALSCPELEMLAECAIWLSEFDEYFQALEKAYALHLEQGRKAAAAGVALALVAGYVEMNASAVARGWQRKAERLLRDEPESIEHGRLYRRQTAEAMSACDFDRAEDLNRRCAAVADRLDDAELRTIALHDRGRILIHLGNVEEGTALVDEAMSSAAGGAVGPMTLGNLYCRTLTVCRMIADFDRVREWTEAASRWCQPHGASGYPGICRVHSAETMRHQGRWMEAEAAVRAACTFFERVGPPSHAGEALNELGELLLRKGEFPDAEDAFRRAHEFGHDPVPGLPLLRLAQKNVEGARQVIERAIGENPDDRLLRARLLSAGILIWIANGDLIRAETAVDELAATSAAYRCPAFRGQAALGRGIVEMARGNHRAATPALREAWSAFHAAGFPYDAARARVLLGRTYLAAGDTEDARLQLDAARKTFDELGARPDLEAVSALIGTLG